MVLVVGGYAVGAVASSTPTVKACLSSKGYLGLPSSKGRCAKGYKGVNINQQGVRGATGRTGPTGKPGTAGKAGPGALTDVVDTTKSGLTVGTKLVVGKDAVTAQCLVGSGAYAELSIALPGSSSYVDGTVFAPDAGDVQAYDVGGGVTTYPAGSSLVSGKSSDGNSDLIATPSNSTPTAYASTHLLINDGPTVFTIDASLAASTSRCRVVIEVVPGS